MGGLCGSGYHLGLPWPREAHHCFIYLFLKNKFKLEDTRLLCNVRENHQP